jgi:NhaP-type Na+/H+ or K+/H+ antiporter
MFGHTTSVIVILGILVSFTIRYIVINDNQTDSDILFQSLRFNDDIFFDLIVPVIIFPSGYNMRRKKFFSNIGSIMKFGFLGTIICFAVYSGMTYFINSQEWIYYTNSAGEYVPIKLSLYYILLICSLLCSSDVIAAISMIDYKQQPKLFSIVYGEGVFNDIVSIILFNTVNKYFNKNSQFEWDTIFIIIIDFTKLASSSLLIGLIFGAISSIIFKIFRFLTHSAITETLLLLIIGLISYFVS